jgi:hypothetical protein
MLLDTLQAMTAAAKAQGPCIYKHKGPYAYSLAQL